MATDRSYRVRPGQRHRLMATTEARVLEVSTPELEDVTRWDDDYGRAVQARNGRRRMGEGGRQPGAEQM